MNLKRSSLETSNILEFLWQEIAYLYLQFINSCEYSWTCRLTPAFQESLSCDTAREFPGSLLNLSGQLQLDSWRLTQEVVFWSPAGARDLGSPRRKKRIGINMVVAKNTLEKICVHFASQVGESSAGCGEADSHPVQALEPRTKYIHIMESNLWMDFSLWSATTSMLNKEMIITNIDSGQSKHSGQRNLRF